MRLLCDHNVDERYIDTFRHTEWLTVATVRDELTQDADDVSISEYAEQHGWVVFTEDDDFHELAHDRGVIFYNHIENPPPSDVLTALRRIVEVYEDHRNIIEYVPGEWIQ